MTSNSSTSLAIGTGSKTLTIGTGLTIAAGTLITLTASLDRKSWMDGVVTSYTSLTGVLVLNVTSINGSGTFTAWLVDAHAPDGNDLTTIRDAIGYLPEMATASPLLIQRLITAGSGFIQTHLNRLFASQAYTETRSGTGTAMMMFANYPVTAVSSLTVDEEEIDAYTAGANDIGYVFDETTLYLKNGGVFSRDIMNVSMTYTAGYTTIPFEIAQACIKYVGLEYKERDRLGTLSRGIGPEATSYTKSNMTEDMKSLNRQYQKRIPV
ncbi:MAG: hypothetical protein ABFD81_19100 [Syntrophaceae bacterium]